MKGVIPPLLLLIAVIGAPPDVYEPPPADRLDERIDPQKITHHDPPPLPQQVILPVPPEFRVTREIEGVPISRDHFDRAHAALVKALAYLSSMQNANGGWLTEILATPTDQPDKPSPIAVAVTALAVKGFVQANDPQLIDAGRFGAALEFIRSGQTDDGSFDGAALTNYVTSTVVMALASVDHHDFDDEIADACGWL